MIRCAFESQYIYSCVWSKSSKTDYPSDNIEEEKRRDFHWVVRGCNWKIGAKYQSFQSLFNNLKLWARSVERCDTSQHVFKNQYARILSDVLKCWISDESNVFSQVIADVCRWLHHLHLAQVLMHMFVQLLVRSREFAKSRFKYLLFVCYFLSIFFQSWC